ncbi:unnamed protein product [Caretta caretta]
MPGAATREENQRLEEHAEELTEKMSIMESRLAGLKQAPTPDEAVHTTGEAPSASDKQSLPHNPATAASIPDSSLLHISPKEDRRLFEEAKGDIAKYALAVFRDTMLQDYYQQWRGKANVSGTHQKAALSPNLVNAAFKAAKKQKPELAGKDYSNLKIQINNLMRSRKSRSLVVSTGQS